MHDALLANSSRLEERRIRAIAADMALDLPAFDLCLSTGIHDKAVRTSASEARQIGITGTPTFVLGAARGNVLRGSVIRGYQSFESFRLRIDALMSRTERRSSPAIDPLGGSTSAQ